MIFTLPRLVTDCEDYLLTRAGLTSRAIRGHDNSSGVT